MVLGGAVRMFVFLFSSLFYIPRVACEPAICKNMRILLCVSFLDFLLSVVSLPEMNFSPSLSCWSCDFLLRFRFFDVELLFSSCLFFLGSMWSSRFLWRLVQRTACIWYVRARTSLFIFSLRFLLVLQLSCVLLLACFLSPRYFPPLQNYWTLSCDHGLHCIVAMSERENNNHNNDRQTRMSKNDRRVCHR